MADFVRITQSMAEQGLDALLALGMRNCAYLAGAVSEGPWLNEPQGLAPWMTCLIPPDRSFTFGSRFRDTDLPVDSLAPDNSRAARLTALADEMRQRGLARARIGLDMDFAAVSDLERLKNCCRKRRLSPPISCSPTRGRVRLRKRLSGSAKQLPPPKRAIEICCGRCAWASRFKTS